jgi:formamidopyrimidine-DNA glycosylase
MPELPEVTTTVNGLQKVLPGLFISDVWTDLAKKNQKIKHFKGTIKDKDFFDKFKKEIKGKRVLRVERRAKNILINLSNSQTILIHLKMTGHIIYGKYIYNKKKNIWTPDKNEHEALHDPFNRFVHVVFTLSNKKHFVMCDSRKFGKVTLIDTRKAHESIHLKGIGPEPLDKNFTFKDFTKRLALKPNKNIKTVLMNQEIIAGIGNIYSDEMLWLAGIHPESKSKNIPTKELKDLYKYMKQVLNKGIDFGGDSMSDYRDVRGMRGNFQNHHNVYKKKGERCGKKGCNGVIIRKVLDGRSAHFCNKHQKLYLSR